MNHKMKALLIIGLSGLFLPLFAGSIEPLNLKDITERADRIFEGRCVGVEHTVVKSRKGMDIPAVTYTFQILDGLKGKVSERVTVSHLGSFQDGRPFLVNADKLGIQKYKEGNTYLLFLNRDSYHGLSATLGLPQGVFEVKEGRARNRAGNRFILTGLDKAVVGTPYAAWLAPGGNRAGKTADSEGIPADGLKSLVRDLISGKVKAPSRKEVL
ncbi:MAG: hypothetical protein QNK37_37790 [Acidobacteriota bacterium]|nr:hypothetical protein [Acidobacteriota bacterium]